MKNKIILGILVALVSSCPLSAADEIFTGIGDSMEPYLHSGQKVMLIRIDYSQLRPGMVVIFMGQDCRPICHILVEKWKEGWVTKGCNNCENDDTIMTDKVYMGIAKPV